MSKEIYKPTPEEEKAAQENMSVHEDFQSRVRSETLEGSKVVLDYRRSMVFEGGKIFLDKNVLVDEEKGTMDRRRSELTPQQAIEGIEHEEQSIQDKIRELQSILEKRANLKERILRMKTGQIEKEN